ncbi:hypothetical protein CF327_g4452 [Tilletia walkeri]|nr:hypothetical protein CF327_g4452 [Tilletia walkeri]
MVFAIYLARRCLRHSTHAAVRTSGSAKASPLIGHISDNDVAVARSAFGLHPTRVTSRELSSNTSASDEARGDGVEIKSPPINDGGKTPSEEGISAVASSLDTREQDSDPTPALEETTARKETMAERDARLMALFSDREGGSASYGSVEGDRLYGGMGSQTKRNMFRVI